MNRAEWKRLEKQTPEELKILINKLRSFLQRNEEYFLKDEINKTITDLELRYKQKTSEVEQCTSGKK